MSSKIPDTLDYLVAKLPGAMTGEVQILDGPPVVSMENEGIAIGYVPDRLSVEAEVTPGDLSGSDMETFDVNCTAWVRSGDNPMLPVRTRVFAILTELDTVLARDPRLGGNVVQARLGILDLDQLQTDEGTWATIAFQITCKAFK